MNKASIHNRVRSHNTELFHLSELSDSFKRDLVEGWSFLDRMKDDTDEDWSIWRQFILQTLSGWVEGPVVVAGA
jgi:uncharacterized protein YtpQ (UPF0354 family)